MIKTYPFKSSYFITSIKEHYKNKETLLSEIDKMSSQDINNPAEKLKTDFFLDKNQDRQYLKLFYDMIESYMQDLCNLMQTEEWIIHNGWYQQYTVGGTHGWHNHAQTNFTNVYFLELPDPSLKTQIFDSINQKIIDTVEIKEGDILTIPGHLLHKSRKNETLQRKTIISFNSSFTGADDLKIENNLKRKDHNDRS